MPIKPPKRKEPTPAQIRKWLTDNGHGKDKVDKLDMSNKDKAKKSVLNLHKADAQ